MRLNHGSVLWFFSKHCCKVLFALTALGFPGMLKAGVSTNWDQALLVGIPTVGLGGLTYFHGQYVTVGGWGYIYTSSNGTNWIYTGIDMMDAGGFACGNDRMVIMPLTGGPNIMSTNGTNWIVSYGGPAASEVTFGNGVFVAVGAENNAKYTSYDGLTWSAHGASTNRFTRVAYGAGKFVALTTDGYAWSANGTNWFKHSLPLGREIASNNKLFISPLCAGTNLYSSDGILWNTAKTGVPGLLDRVKYLNGLFLARCAETNLATSNDGLNWKIVESFPNLNSIASDGTRFLCMGTTFAYFSRPVVGRLSANVTSPGHLTFSGFPGATYRLEAADKLTNGASMWQPLVTFSSSDAPFDWTDPSNTKTNASRFYRTVLIR